MSLGVITFNLCLRLSYSAQFELEYTVKSTINPMCFTYPILQPKIKHRVRIIGSSGRMPLIAKSPLSYMLDTDDLAINCTP